jgi:hypothetical protein
MFESKIFTAISHNIFWCHFKDDCSYTGSSTKDDENLVSFLATYKKLAKEKSIKAKIALEVSIKEENIDKGIFG